MKLALKHICLTSSHKALACLILLLCSSMCVWAQSAQGVEKVTITVSDLDRAVGFYTTILEFQKVGEYDLDAVTTQQLFGLTVQNVTAEVATLKLGNEVIELMEFSGMALARAIPMDSRSNDLWFQHIAIVVSDMSRAYDKVRAAKVTYVSTSPQTLPAYIPAAAGITAFYFRDPDGHNLELIQYPKDKGNPKWQLHHEGALFLGIDHTAIGIDDTDRGLDFYHEALKLSIAGTSENYGSEQEHLNQVFGARLLITGLQATDGFGIEFLDYIAPPGGRTYPIDSSPTDLWHWHTTIAVTGIETLRDRLIENGFTLVSHGIVTVGTRQALLARDRDGHAIMLVEPFPNTSTSR